MIYSVVCTLGGFALVSAASLTLHDLSLRKTPEANPIPIPPECGDTFQCSTDWLSQALGFSLDSHSQKSIGGGLSTGTIRLNLNPSDPNSNPRSVVVKYYSEADANNWKKRFMIWLTGGIEKTAKKEKFFYVQLRSRLEEIGVNTPKPFYLAIQDYGGRSPLLYISGWKTLFKSIFILEDLSGFKCFGTGKHLPEEYAVIASKNLAKLHASSWNNTQSLQLENPNMDWTPAAYNFLFGLSTPCYRYPKSKETVTQRMNNWKEEFPILKDPELRSSLISLTDLFPKITYLQNEGSLFSHSTLLHGDYHPGNMFFVNDPETKKVNDSIFIDWQFYGIGNPSTEVAYFLLLNITPDPERDERVMKVYYDELTKKVSPDSYPWEVFVREVEIRTVALMAWHMSSLKRNPEESKKNLEMMSKENLDFQEFSKTLISSNLTRFNYIFQKWQKENFIQFLENIKIKEDEKYFLGIKVPKFDLLSLVL